MTPKTMQHAESETLMALAEGLRQSCEMLRTSAALAKSGAEDGIEESCQQHLDSAGALREQVCRQARALRRRRGEAEDIAPRLRRQLEDRVNESRHMLEEAGQAYGALASRIAALREEVGRELTAMGRGRKVLGAYKRAGRPRAARGLSPSIRPVAPPARV